MLGESIFEVQGRLRSVQEALPTLLEKEEAAFRPGAKIPQ